MKKSPAMLLFIPLLLVSFPIAAQTASAIPLPSRTGASDPERPLLAVSNENYPVTPGDVYRLTYQLAGNITNFQPRVQSDYGLRLVIFGKITAANMSFGSIRKRVEGIVLGAYPGSLPSFTIVSLGIFQVSARGFVLATHRVSAWGLFGLSDVVRDNLGPHSSIRDITISSVGSQTRQYDLFKGFQRGITEEDPYLKPRDTIIVSRIDREAQISGEAYRSGTCQLIVKDDLKTLVEDNAGGFTIRADPARIRIDRVQENGAKCISLDPKETRGVLIELVDGDSVVVLSILDNPPVVFFGEAVEAGAATGPGTTAKGAGDCMPNVNCLTFSYGDGATLQNALQSIRSRISPLANLAHAYVMRATPPRLIPADLATLLYTDRSSQDMPLDPFDRIMIPMSPSGVSVAGAVMVPGWYAFVPEKTYGYYLELAGTMPPGDMESSIAVFDAWGVVQEISRLIQPGDRIMATRPTISVSGAVVASGSYPFVAGRPARYDIDLAGGVNRQFSGGGRFVVTSGNGKPRPPNQFVEIGDSICLPKNDSGYSLNQVLSVVANTVTVINRSHHHYRAA